MSRKKTAFDFLELGDATVAQPAMVAVLGKQGR